MGRKIQFKHDLSHDLEPSGVPSGKSCCSDDLGGCIVSVVGVFEENRAHSQVYELATETKRAQLEFPRDKCGSHKGMPLYHYRM